MAISWVILTDNSENHPRSLSSVFISSRTDGTFTSSVAGVTGIAFGASFTYTRNESNAFLLTITTSRNNSVSSTSLSNFRDSSYSISRFFSHDIAGQTDSESLSETIFLPSQGTTFSQTSSSLGFLFTEIGSYSAFSSSSSSISQAGGGDILGRANALVQSQSLTRQASALTKREFYVYFDKTGRTSSFFSTTETFSSFFNTALIAISRTFKTNNSTTGSILSSSSTETTASDSFLTASTITSSLSNSQTWNGEDTFTTSTRTKATSVSLTTTETQTYSTSFSLVFETTTLTRVSSVFSERPVTTTEYATTGILRSASFANATVYEAENAEVLFPILTSFSGSDFLTNPSTRFTVNFTTVGDTAPQRNTFTVSSSGISLQTTSSQLPSLTVFNSGTNVIHTSSNRTLNWQNPQTQETTQTAARERISITGRYGHSTTFSSSALFQSDTSTGTGVVFFTGQRRGTFSEWLNLLDNRTVSNTSSSSTSTLTNGFGATGGSTTNFESSETRLYTDVLIPDGNSAGTGAITSANIIRFASQRPSFFTLTDSNGETFQSSRKSISLGFGNDSFAGMGAASQSLTAYLFFDGLLRATRISSDSTSSLYSSFESQNSNINQIELAIDKPLVLLNVNQVRRENTDFVASQVYFTQTNVNYEIT